ncbi:MAG: protein kinase [Proteobacteria bacterium]|nr:protein kinase [Pseudomonadota bacterium]
MNTQRWLRAGEIFDRVFAVPPAQRSALVESLCGDDHELKIVVESMLNGDDAALAAEQAAADIVSKRDPVATTAANAADEPAPDRVGPWRLVEKIGDGGMGVVWLAERADGQFEQRAALKLIKRGMDSDAVLTRFLRERQILARLQHPQIAHLLDGGITDDGRPYFAMEYVDGQASQRYCHDNDLKLEDRIRLFLDVCAAVQFAHAHHVVHRDLKPSNVLVTPNGAVKLLDFGIAKVLEDSSNGELTLTQARRERPMSPAYAAPEQFSGGKITEATDIYALGCVLYQLLTDKYAYDFRGAERPEDLRRIVEASDPVPPSRLRLTAPPVPSRRLRGDLDTIVLAALKHDPARRYPSVSAMADDLRRYITGKPINARRDHLAYRGWKYVRRHRVGVVATAAVVAIALVAALFELRGKTTYAAPPPGTSMAIVDFSNLSQDKRNDWIATALGNELATELTSGTVMHAMPGELVNAARAGLSPPGAGGYGPASLRVLRKRLGADYVLSGSYLVSGPAEAPSLRLDVAVQDARNDAPVASVAESGALNELPRLVEQAGAGLRAKLGLATGSAATREQVARAQPGTLDLSRRMGLALAALRSSEPVRARDELLEAVALNPGYAPAYSLLAEAWRKLGYDDKALAMAEQAVAHSAGLPQQQQMQIARVLAVQKREWDKALALDESLLKQAANNPELHLTYIDDLRRAGRADKADAALAELRKLPASRDDPRVELAAVHIAELRDDSTAYARHAELALALATARDEPGLAADALYDLGIARTLQGRVEEAVGLMQRAIADYRRGGNLSYEADAHAQLGLLESQRGNPVAARREYQSALDILQKIGNPQRMYEVYAHLFQMHWDLGDRDTAQVMLRHIADIVRVTGEPRQQAWLAVSQASLKLDDGADEAALAAYREALALAERSGWRELRIAGLQQYSEALRLRGDLDDARNACEQALSEARQATDLPNFGAPDYQCALVQRDRGERKAANAGFERALARAKALHEDGGVAVDSLGLAQGELEQQRWVDACRRLGDIVPVLAKSEDVAHEALAQSLLALCHAHLGQEAESTRAESRARELRSRLLLHLPGVPVDIALLQLKGVRGDAAAAAALQALADRVEKRHWIALALDARLAALELLAAHDPAQAAALKKRIDALARQHGFAGVLVRAEALAGSRR